MTEKKNMRVIAIAAFGGPDRLTLMQIPIPIPGPDEVLIRVQAAGVGLWDVKVRRGQVGERSFPFVLGWESAGIVVQTGANVTSLQVGDAIYCYVQQVGHYAEYIAAPANLVARKPGTIDAAHAAGIPISGLTAHQALTEALGLQAGETVLITAAAGGVGSFAVQIATQLGAQVIATASVLNHAYLRELGARWVIDYTTTDFVQAVHALHPAGVDAVLDCIGGETVIRSLQALRDRGRLAYIAEAADLSLERGITAHLVYGRPDAQRLTTLAQMVDAGQLTVHLDRTLSLEAAKEAHELVEEGHVRGKMVLTIGNA
jgi:NADPH:quinone reductase-like Zn-dependent oxidoreductase